MQCQKCLSTFCIECILTHPCFSLPKTPFSSSSELASSDIHTLREEKACKLREGRRRWLLEMEAERDAVRDKYESLRIDRMKDTGHQDSCILTKKAKKKALAKT
jgi:hypothetical protein